MATVRMSDKLKYAILDEAEHQFQNVNKEKEIPLDVGDAIYTKYAQPIVDSVQNLIIKYPHVKNFMSFENMSEISVGFVIPSDVSDQDQTYSSTSQLKMSAERPFPRGGGNSYNYNHISFHIPHDCEHAEKIREVKNHNEDVSTRRADYRAKVRDTIENFTTVNQALKAWPALEKLIAGTSDGAWVLQRVNEKVQRKKKQAEQRAEIELNETDLNSVILTNALIGDD